MYNEAGNVVSVNSFVNKNDSTEMIKTGETVYKYYRKSGLLKSKVLKTNYSKSETKYAYDSIGNWNRFSERASYKKVGRETKTIRREIEYFL